MGDACKTILCILGLLGLLTCSSKLIKLLTAGMIFTFVLRLLRPVTLHLAIPGDFLYLCVCTLDILLRYICLYKCTHDCVDCFLLEVVA